MAPDQVKKLVLLCFLWLLSLQTFSTMFYHNCSRNKVFMLTITCVYIFKLEKSAGSCTMLFTVMASEKVKKYLTGAR